MAAMMAQLYVDDPSPHAPDELGARRTLLKLDEEPTRGRAIVLESEGVVVGYALLCAFWSNELGGEICVIDEIYVKPPYRGNGIATWLVHKLLEHALPWFTDCVAVELEVTPSNDRARALYERLGFRAKKNAVLRYELK